MLEKYKNDLYKSGEIYLRIKVQPQMTKTEYSNIMTDEKGIETIKIKVNAAPEKGKANKELLSYLSKILEVPKKNITIISGNAHTLKLIKVIKQL